MEKKDFKLCTDEGYEAYLEVHPSWGGSDGYGDECMYGSFSDATECDCNCECVECD